MKCMCVKEAFSHLTFKSMNFYVCRREKDIYVNLCKKMFSVAMEKYI